MRGFQIAIMPFAHELPEGNEDGAPPQHHARAPEDKNIDQLIDDCAQAYAAFLRASLTGQGEKAARNVLTRCERRLAKAAHSDSGGYDDAE